VKLSTKIMFALVLGILAGLIAGDYVIVLKPIGTIFLNSIKMTMIPLVVSSIVTAMAHLASPGRLQRIGLRGAIWAAGMTSFAIGLGLTLGTVFQPGKTIHWVQPSNTTFAETSLGGLLVGVIPQNPIEALSTGNMLQVVAFTFLFGLALIRVGQLAKPVIDFFNAIAVIMEALTQVVLMAAPVGIFSIIAVTVAQQGAQFIGPLVIMIGALILGCVIQIGVVYGGVLRWVVKRNPIDVFSHLKSPLIFAFSTTSVGATLPLTIHAVTQKLGVPEPIARFVLPIAAVANKGGTVIYQCIAVVFISQIYGIHLSLTHYGMIGLMTLISSFGTPSVPGAGLVILGAILKSVGLPLEGLALIAGVDRIFDMIRTPTNVVGDCVLALVVNDINDGAEVSV